jgi:hypothetical protein
MEVHEFAWWVAACFSAAAVGVSWTLIRDHLQRNHNPSLRKYVVRVIFLIPVYAIESWLGLRFTHGYFFFDTLRDCYEAFVIFSFYRFLVEYLGGESWLILRLGERRSQHHTTPFCWLPTWQPSSKFVLYTKFGALQYVFIKVLVAIIEVVLVISNKYEAGSFASDSAYLWLALIVNFSQIWAIYCLALLYLAASDLLKPIKPLPKFLCIKAVVFFTFWQSVLISLLEGMGIVHDTVSYSSENIAAGLQDFIICIEMFIAAIAFRMAFPVSDFPQIEDKAGVSGGPVLHKLLKAANVADVVHEVTIPRDNQVSMNVMGLGSPARRPSDSDRVDGALLEPEELDDEDVESAVLTGRSNNKNHHW